jgi:cytochrome c biogenesis protein CcmG, thiol:disulfide interchange protein DsbE
VLYQLSYRRTAREFTPFSRPRAPLRPSPAPGRPAVYALLALRRLLPPALASLLGAALVALLLYGVTHESPSRTIDQALAEGRRPLAPEASYRLPRLGGGGTASLASFRGHVVVLNFWASWCPGCEAEAPAVERLQRGLARFGAGVLGVAYEDASSDSLRFMRTYRVTFPNLADGSGEFGRTAYGTAQLPESFLIDPSGRIAAVARGEIEPAFVEKALTLARSSAPLPSSRGRTPRARSLGAIAPPRG